MGAVHLKRSPTALQKSVLEWLYPTCAREGCGASEGLQRDHRKRPGVGVGSPRSGGGRGWGPARGEGIAWAKAHRTEVRFMDHLCGPDHDLKTRFNWALVEGTGVRPMVPPDDPRHPDNVKRLREAREREDGEGGERAPP